MSELEKVYNKHYILDFHSGENIMSFNQFKSALNEVLKLVEVTDEEIEGSFDFEPIPNKDHLNIAFKAIAASSYFGAKWSRDLSKTKLEKLIG